MVRHAAVRSMRLGLLLGYFGVAHAGPLAPLAEEAQDTKRVSPISSESVSATGTSKTIDLLLSAPSSPDVPAPTRAGAREPVLPSAPDGSKVADRESLPGLLLEAKEGTTFPRTDAERRDSGPGPSAEASRSWSAGRPDATATARHGPSARSPAEPEWSILEVPAIRFIREHRMLVLAGCVALVLFVWGASSYRPRRRR